MTKHYKLLACLAPILAGCDDSAVISHNQMISRCNSQTVYAGTALDDRRDVFLRKDQLKSGCPSHFVSAIDDLPSKSVAVYGLPAGFYPQGQSDRKELDVTRKYYEKAFAKNYSDYQATLNSTTPAKCLGSSFYACVKRLSDTLTVTTDTTGSYISKTAAKVTVRSPMSQDQIIDNQMTLDLMSNSGGKVTNKILLSFNVHQAASLATASSKEDLYGSNLYEVFSAISSQCEATGRDKFYSDMSRLLSGKETSRNHLNTTPISATVATSWSSNRSVRLCGMSVKSGGFNAISVDWNTSARLGRSSLEIRP